MKISEYAEIVQLIDQVSLYSQFKLKSIQRIKQNAACGDCCDRS